MPTIFCADEDIKVMKATEHTCAYYAEAKEGHCDNVFCEDCPFAHFCDRACGYCPDAHGGFRPPFWVPDALTMTDLEDVKEANEELEEFREEAEEAEEEGEFAHEHPNKFAAAEAAAEAAEGV
jgi:hypothetical protein